MVFSPSHHTISLQRRHQKIVEFCPSPTLVHLPRLRASILAAATTLCQRAKLDSLATVEFLVVEPELSSSKEGHYYFLEANPRLQVEHTVTEQAFGLDLVAVQIEAAFGRTLGTLRWPTNASRCSIQLRLNAERFSADGTWVPTVGSVSAFSPPTGPFVRVDTALHAPLPVPVGLYRQTLLYDSLLAKIIVTGSSYKVTVSAAIRALEQMFLEGVSTNRELLLSLMRHPAVASNTGIHTRFIDDIAEELSATSQGAEAAPKVALTQASQVPHEPSPEQGTESAALLVPPGHQCLYGTLPGKVIKIECVVGDEIAVADQIALLESMKMEHTVRATVSGVVKSILCRPGDILKDGDPIILLDLTRDPSRSPTARLAPKEVTMSETSTDTASDTDAMEALQAIRAQRDDSHPLRQHLVARRHRKSYRTAQENLTSLLDIEKLDIEYGDLAVAAQRTRLDSEGLARTRGDGVVTGFGRVNSSVLPGSVRERDRQARCAVVMYDYTVLADTQGYFHHSKIDRLFAQVLSNPCPLILYAEGGGGRPADVDAAHIKIAGLDTHSFPLLAEISARGIPIVGVANGYTFAGNAALLGTSDIVIATKNSSTGFGGPAMIEGGGLGKVRPDQIGPPSSHLANGNIDILVDDEEEATEVVQKVVSFWQGETIFEPSRFPKKDRRALRGIIPASTRRAYDVRDILNLLADTEFLEIGKMWGKSLTCGFLRIEGRPLAVIASNVSSELGGAIDAASAKKATRFVRLLSKTRCAHLVALCDTPGFLVGSSAEKDPLGALRAFPEYFAACAAFRGVGGGQIFGLTLKRGVGLGAQAVLGGSTLSNLHSVAWPGAAFAAMGIQGAVRLGWSKQLSACRSEEEREEMERKLVQELTNRGDAVRMAEAGEIDTVIDPAETHDWLKYCLDAAPQRRGITEQAHRMRYKERL